MKPLFKFVVATALMGGLSFQAHAQNDWPKVKPVTLVVAFAPGASTDIVARSLTQKLNELTGGNFISLQTRQSNIEGAGEIGLERLVREALRMRPDRIAVGEIRGSELLVMIQAFNTGHTGGGATIHANNFESVSERIAAIGWQGGLPGNELLAQSKAAIDWLIFVGREGDLRKVQRIGRWQ